MRAAKPKRRRPTAKLTMLPPIGEPDLEAVLELLRDHLAKKILEEEAKKRAELEGSPRE